MEESWPRKGPDAQALGSLLGDRCGRRPSGRDQVPRSRGTRQGALGLCVCQDPAPCGTGRVGVGRAAGGLAGNAWPLEADLAGPGCELRGVADGPWGQGGGFCQLEIRAPAPWVAWAGESRVTEHTAPCRAAVTPSARDAEDASWEAEAGVASAVHQQKVQRGAMVPAGAPGKGGERVSVARGHLSPEAAGPVALAGWGWVGGAGL